LKDNENIVDNNDMENPNQENERPEIENVECPENVSLQESLTKSEKLAKDYYDQLLRLKADFENYRRRSEKEKRDYLEWGKEKIILKHIAIGDVLEQALKSARNGDNSDSILIGLEMISKEFSKMLIEEGVEEIKIDKFDPEICEAVDFEQKEDLQEGEILSVYQKGYKMNGRLIRTAKVKVAKNK
jgi:molecular chaperone GrpE